ncbi:hypothetical protein, partial [Marinitenerispora sediminis]
GGADSFDGIGAPAPERAGGMAAVPGGCGTLGGGTGSPARAHAIVPCSAAAAAEPRAHRPSEPGKRD